MNHAVACRQGVGARAEPPARITFSVARRDDKTSSNPGQDRASAWRRRPSNSRCTAAHLCRRTPHENLQQLSGWGSGPATRWGSLMPAGPAGPFSDHRVAMLSCYTPQEDQAYNGLVVAWPQIQRLVARVASSAGTTQEELF